MHSLTKDWLLPGIFDCVLNANLYMFCSSKQSNENRAPIKAGLRTYTPALFENNTAFRGGPRGARFLPQLWATKNSNPIDKIQGFVPS